MLIMQQSVADCTTRGDHLQMCLLHFVLRSSPLLLSGHCDGLDLVQVTCTVRLTPDHSEASIMQHVTSLHLKGWLWYTFSVLVMQRQPRLATASKSYNMPQAQQLMTSMLTHQVTVLLA